MKNTVFFIILFGLLTGATLVVVEIADQLLLRLQPHALMYPAHKTIVFPSEEGGWTVHTNWLGLRDPERHHIARKNGLRVAAIGDSTTFGFGVNDEDTWPHLLETRLDHTEVWNLGRPGGGPLEYAQIAEAVIDYLHPDLILVGILQADDVKQCTARSHPAPELVVPMTKRWLPGLSLTAARIKNKPSFWESYPGQIEPLWKDLAHSIVGSFTTAQREKYEKIPEQARSLFMAGLLNPALVALAITQPSYMGDPLKENRETQNLSACLRDALLRIRTVAERNNAQVLVMSLPSGFFTSRQQLETRAALGFEVEEDFLTTRKVDDIVASAAQSAGLAFVTFTDQFRKESLREHLFLEWDGHYGPTGTKLLSQLIATHLMSKPNLSLSDSTPAKN